MDKEFEYGKWDSAEDPETAYYNVSTGVWDYKRFEKWVRRVELDEYRSNCADESF